jgi:transposase
MRGNRNPQPSMFMAVPVDRRVPADHPLRGIKAYSDACLAELAPIFEEAYSKKGRPSVPPERLLKALLLMALYSIRSERMFCEQLEYNLLFRWFLDMDINETAFNHSVFSHNKERLLEHEVAGEFFRRIVALARRQNLISDEHFTVDGTLIESWASIKSFRPKDENDPPPPSDIGGTSVNFKGEKRSNDTHQSKTDPEARLARKGLGKEAKLSVMAHALMENRNGLAVDFMTTQATGTAERDAALAMLARSLHGTKRRTLGADKGYESFDFVEKLRAQGVTPHIAARSSRSTVDGRTTRHAGYLISQRKRKLVEQIFGWTKTVAAWRKSRYVGLRMNDFHLTIVGAAYNLTRMAKLRPLAAS